MAGRLKLLYIGTFTGYWVSDKYRLNGFKKIFNVKHYDYREIGDINTNSIEMFKCVMKFIPDIIFINKGEKIHQLLIKRIRSFLPNVKIFLFNGDQRGDIQQDVVRLGLNCDAILINNFHKEQWDKYKSLGIKKIYEYHTATDISIYKPMKHIDKKYDIVFAGGHYINAFPLSAMRFELIRELSKEFKVAIAGSKNWKVVSNAICVGGKYNEEFVEFISSGKIILGISAYDKINHYTSNRTWNSLATGIPYLCHRYKGCELFFTDMENIVYFDNIRHCIENVKTILDNYSKYSVIGMNGRKLVANEHTYYHRALQLQDIYMEMVR